MPRKHADPAVDLGDQLDAALGGILAAGWDDPVETAVAAATPSEPAGRAYPPLPTREAPTAPPRRQVKPPLPPPSESLEPQAHGGALLRREAEPPDEPDGEYAGMFNVGALADLAAGRATVTQVAGRMGLGEDQLQSELAVALRDMDPKEIVKALGLQASEQQLKSGAVYGAVLSDLVADMAAGRLKPDTKIELAKLLAKVGRIEPKEDKGTAAGQGFVLNIQLGGAPAQPITIDSN